jgi:hypothetical protein
VTPNGPIAPAPNYRSVLGSGCTIGTEKLKCLNWLHGLNEAELGAAWRR